MENQGQSSLSQGNSKLADIDSLFDDLGLGETASSNVSSNLRPPNISTGDNQGGASSFADFLDDGISKAENATFEDIFGNPDTPVRPLLNMSKDDAANQSGYSAGPPTEGGADDFADIFGDLSAANVSTKIGNVLAPDASPLSTQQNIVPQAEEEEEEEEDTLPDEINPAAKITLNSSGFLESSLGVAISPPDSFEDPTAGFENNSQEVKHSTPSRDDMGQRDFLDWLGDEEDPNESNVDVSLMGSSPAQDNSTAITNKGVRSPSFLNDEDSDEEDKRTEPEKLATLVEGVPSEVLETPVFQPIETSGAGAIAAPVLPVKVPPAVTTSPSVPSGPKQPPAAPVPMARASQNRSMVDLVDMDPEQFLASDSPTQIGFREAWKRSPHLPSHLRSRAWALLLTGSADISEDAPNVTQQPGDDALEIPNLRAECRAVATRLSVSGGEDLSVDELTDSLHQGVLLYCAKYGGAGEVSKWLCTEAVPGALATLALGLGNGRNSFNFKAASVCLPILIDQYIPFLSSKISNLAQSHAHRLASQHFRLLVSYHAPILCQHLDSSVTGWESPQNLRSLAKEQLLRLDSDVSDIVEGLEAKLLNKPADPRIAFSKSEGDVCGGPLNPLWLHGMFVGCLPLNELMILWDNILGSDNRSLGFFLTLSLLLKHEQELCDLQSESLAIKLASIFGGVNLEVFRPENESNFNSEQLIREWRKDATYLQKCTPESYVFRLKEICNKGVLFAEKEEEAHRVEEWKRLNAQAHRVLGQRKSKDSEPNSPVPGDNSGANFAIPMKRTHGEGTTKKIDLTFLEKMENTFSRTAGGESSSGVDDDDADSNKSSSVNIFQMVDEEELFCLTVSPLEVLEFLCRKSRPQSLDDSGRMHQSEIRFYAVDCRKTAEREKGYFPTSFHIDPQNLNDPEELQKILGIFDALRGKVHICLMGSGEAVLQEMYFPKRNDAARRAAAEDASNIRLCATMFIKRGFQYVSLLAGGYAGLHTLLTRQTAPYPLTTLADHQADSCRLCSLEKVLKKQLNKNTPATPSQQPPQQKKLFEVHFDIKNPFAKSAAPGISPAPVQESETGRRSSECSDGQAPQVPSNAPASSSQLQEKLNPLNWKLKAKLPTVSAPNASEMGSFFTLPKPGELNPPDPASAALAAKQGLENFGTSAKQGLENLSKDTKQGFENLGTGVSSLGNKFMTSLRGASSNLKPPVAAKAPPVKEHKPIGDSKSVNSYFPILQQSGITNSTSTVRKPVEERRNSFPDKGTKSLFVIGYDSDDSDDENAAEGESRSSHQSTRSPYVEPEIEAEKPVVQRENSFELEKRRTNALAQHRISGMRKGDLFPLSEVEQAGGSLFTATKSKTIGTGAPEESENAELDAVQVHRFIVVTNERILVLSPPADVKLEEIDMNSLACSVKSNHHLTELIRMTFPKKDPSLVTLQYRRGPKTAEGKTDTHKKTYRVSDKDSLMKTLQQKMAHFR